ncbi:MAG: lysylphosphatidylglycerol synthase transmembrane domain-containing protein, partial [Candidatus Moraniibacteriota bacterium]
IFSLKVIVSVGLVFWLIERVDWTTVGARLYDVSIPLLFLYVFFQLLGNLISSRKWQIIAGFKGLHFTVKEGFFTYLTGAFINNFLPSTIGGDAYRSLWLAKLSGAKAASLSTVVFDRFIGLWTMALLALCFSPFLFPFIETSAPLALTLMALAAFFVLDLFVTYAYCQPWFHRFVAAIPFHKIRRLFEEIIFYTKKHIWWRTSLWSASFMFVGVALSNFTLFHALGSDIGFLPFLAVIFLVTIISAVPLSINNIGIKEWAYITFFGLVGVSIETAVTVALLSRFLQMLISFIALPQYLSTRKK